MVSTQSDLHPSDSAANVTHAQSGTDAGALSRAIYQDSADFLSLTNTAFHSVGQGFCEPVTGCLQFSEQVANAVTSHTPGLDKAFFEPEKFSPAASTTPEPTKYSAAWYVTTVCENAGKLPWYLLSAKLISKVPGFKMDAGLLSENSMLGMNMKTAAGSGFVIGGLGPTDATKDGSLLGSIKERGLQASVGAGQLALMAGTSALVGKGYMAAEGAFTTGGEALTGSQPLARAAEISTGTNFTELTSTALTHVKVGSIAAISSIPAGLGAGYINAKVHGTKFDPVENIVATTVVGFGLGALGPGPEGSIHTDEVNTKSGDVQNEAKSPLNLETGVMKPGNGYLDQVRNRLGGNPPAEPVMWNGSPSLAAELNQPHLRLASPEDPRIVVGTFLGRSDGLTKVSVRPDTISGVDDGRRYSATFENNPGGILRIDDFADGARWVQQKGDNGQVYNSAMFPDGSVYSYDNRDAWSIEFPNGNYMLNYPEGDVAREIQENGRITRVGRDGTIIPAKP